MSAPFFKIRQSFDILIKKSIAPFKKVFSLASFISIIYSMLIFVSEIH